ncbi:MAG: hypothetical protein Ct9H300mP3_02840 [Gammaproteobacteria bacterium]|nr:MAG: hypothetical protein Ct9H300mP3_02840 [Gammaproteobacteria bacterium]
MVENLLDNTQEIISVSEKKGRAKSILEKNFFPLCGSKERFRTFFQRPLVTGISPLKDESSEIRCAMFANKSHRITFEPKDGETSGFKWNLKYL